MTAFALREVKIKLLTGHNLGTLKTDCLLQGNRLTTVPLNTGLTVELWQLVNRQLTESLLHKESLDLTKIL